MVDRVEERFKVSFHGVAAAFFPVFPYHGHRLMSGSAGTVSMAVFTETDFEKRSQQLCDGLLDHAIQHRWDS